MRAKGLFAALLMLVMGLAAACSQQTTDARETQRSEGSSSTIDDAGITVKVKSSFLSNPGVGGLSIDVDTDKGVVTLNGMVDTSAERSLAENLAREVQGVREVVNSLQVRGASPGGSGNTDFTDAAITAAVKTALAFKKDVKAHNINVETRDGVVTLIGTVDSEAEKELAERTTLDTAGVRSVNNRLNVR